MVFSPVCGCWSFRLWRWNMTFLDTEMRNLAEAPSNTRSLIRTLKPQVCPRHGCRRNKPLWWKSIHTHPPTHTYTHTHTHTPPPPTHTHKHTNTHTSTARSGNLPGWFFHLRDIHGLPLTKYIGKRLQKPKIPKSYLSEKYKNTAQYCFKNFISL